MAWLNNKWINILGIDKLGGRVRFRATEKHITIMWIRELRTYDGNNLCLAQYFHHFPTLIWRIRVLSVILKLLKPRMKKKKLLTIWNDIWSNLPVLVPHNGGLTTTWLNQWFCFCSDNRHDVFSAYHGGVPDGVWCGATSHLVSLRIGFLEPHSQSFLQTLLPSLWRTVHWRYQPWYVTFVCISY